jgi:hypothetical protein
MKIALLCFLCLVTMTCGSASFADEGADEVWVEIRVADRGLGQGLINYYGSMDRKEFVGMMNTTVLAGFVKLNHVAWREKGNILSLSQQNGDGLNYGYSDVAYFRVETIYRIVTLTDAFVKEHFSKGK